jgi:hypothetical protein
MAPAEIFRSPLIVHAAGSVTPDAFVFDIVSALIVGELPIIVNRPLPPNSTVPVLEKVVPLSVIVTGLVGVKRSVPLELVTVPLLVNDPLKVCVELPPLNVAPFATVNAPVILHARVGVTTPVLLIFNIAKVGEEVELKLGAKVPLKFVVPVVVNPEFNVSVCADVPEKVTVPLLVNEPVFVKLPEKVVVVDPAAYVPPDMFIDALTVISPEAV